MTARLRRFALTAHVTTSVGWLGAVAAFLALAVGGLTSDDARSAPYPAMELMAWFVIAPLSVASLLTGVVQSLGTKWGLLRHYWVVAKLLINVFATVVLLLYMESLSSLADTAAETAFSSGDLHGLRVQAVVHASAALALLVVATTLAVYKPPGLTPYGRRHRGPRTSRP